MPDRTSHDSDLVGALLRKGKHEFGTAQAGEHNPRGRAASDHDKGAFDELAFVRVRFRRLLDKS